MSDLELCACGHPKAAHVSVSNAPGLVCTHRGEDREGVCECMDFVRAAQPGDQEEG